MSINFTDFLRFRVRTGEQPITSLDQLKCSINFEIESKEKRICSERIKVKLSRGIWRSDKNLIEIVVNKNINPSIGSTIDSLKYLEPFEALLLIENNCLEVLCDDIPLSVEESVKMFLKNEKQINFYRIYSTLSRSGYFVKRHTSGDKSPFIRSLKRKLSDSFEIDCKQMTSNLNYYQWSQQLSNYKSVLNLRPINQLTQSLDFVEELKKDLKTKDQQSMVYEIQNNSTPVEIDPSLKLFNGSVKPVCGLGSVYSNKELFKLIQSVGPKTVDSFTETESKFEITFDVFKNRTKKVNQRPNFCVVLTKSNETVPKINDIIDLQQKSPSKTTNFAVLDANNFVFYSVSSFEINEEYPVLWQKYCK